jgi:hypothetical protein
MFNCSAKTGNTSPSVGCLKRHIARYNINGIGTGSPMPHTQATNRQEVSDDGKTGSLDAPHDGFGPLV